MSRTQHKSWLVCAILIAAAYWAIGRFFPNPADTTGTQTQLLWRLGAWLISAGVFIFHIGYEHFRLRNSPVTTALHTTTAVALGAFLLALGATIRATSVALQVPFSRYLLALLLWPIFTAIPAFLVSLLAAFVLDRLHRKR